MSDTQLPTVKVDDKYSIQYDPANNDFPVQWFRGGEPHSLFEGNNAIVAMFYALLEKERMRAALEFYAGRTDGPRGINTYDFGKLARETLDAE